MNSVSFVAVFWKDGVFKKAISMLLIVSMIAPMAFAGSRIAQFKKVNFDRMQYMVDPSLKIIKGLNKEPFTNSAALAETIGLSLLQEAYFESKDMFAKEKLGKLLKYLLKKDSVKRIIESHNQRVVSSINNANLSIDATDNASKVVSKNTEVIEDIINSNKGQSVRELENIIKKNPKLNQYFKGIKQAFRKEFKPSVHASHAAKIAKNGAAMISIMIFDIIALSISTVELYKAIQSNKKSGIISASVGVVTSSIGVITAAVTIATSVAAVSAIGSIVSGIISIIAVPIAIGVERQEQIDEFQDNIEKVLALQFAQFHAMAEDLLQDDYDVVLTTNKALLQEDYRKGANTNSDESYRYGFHFSGASTDISYPGERLFESSDHIGESNAYDVELIEKINEKLLEEGSQFCFEANASQCDKDSVYFEQGLMHIGYAGSREYKQTEIDIGIGTNNYHQFEAGKDLLQAIRQNSGSALSIAYMIDGSDLLGYSENGNIGPLRIDTVPGGGNDNIVLKDYSMADSSDEITINTYTGDDIIELQPMVNSGKLNIDGGAGNDVLSLLFYRPTDNRTVRIGFEADRGFANIQNIEHVFMPLYANAEMDIDQNLRGYGVPWSIYEDSYLECDEGSMADQAENNLNNGEIDIFNSIEDFIMNTSDNNHNIDISKMCITNGNREIPIISTMRSVGVMHDESYYNGFDSLGEDISNMASRHTYNLNTSDFNTGTESTFRLKAANPNSTLRVYSDSGDIEYAYLSQQKRLKITDNGAIINLHLGSADINMEVHSNEFIDSHLIKIDTDFAAGSALTLEQLSNDEKYYKLPGDNNYSGSAPFNKISLVTTEDGLKSCAKQYESGSEGVYEQALLVLDDSLLTTDEAYSCAIEGTGEEDDVLIIPNEILKHDVELYAQVSSQDARKIHRVLYLDDRVAIKLDKVYKIVDMNGVDLFSPTLSRNQQTIKLNANHIGIGNMSHYGELSYNGSSRYSNNGHGIGNIMSSSSATDMATLKIDLWEATASSSFDEFIEKVGKYDQLSFSASAITNSEAVLNSGIESIQVTASSQFSSEENFTNVVHRDATTADIYESVVNTPEAYITHNFNFPKDGSYRYLRINIDFTHPFSQGGHYYFWRENPFVLSDVRVVPSRYNAISAQNLYSVPSVVQAIFDDADAATEAHLLVSHAFKDGCVENIRGKAEISPYCSHQNSAQSLSHHYGDKHLLALTDGNGLCLQPEENSNGAQVLFKSCIENPDQQWLYQTASKRFMHVTTSKCLDIHGGNEREAIIWDCHHDDNQKFDSFSSKIERIMSSAFQSGCIQNFNGKAEFETCDHNHELEKQTLTYDQRTQAIINKETNLCLQPSSYTKGSRVEYNECSESSYQKWDYDVSTKRFKHRSYNKCLDIHGGNKRDIIIWDCKEEQEPNQQFNIL